MKRRSFLKASFVGATTLALPSWLGCAFGTGSKGDLFDDDFGKGAPLARAFLRARNHGKPLLVLVVPPQSPGGYTSAEADELCQREYAFGELFNYGAEKQLWPLSLCEVICALPKEIEALFGSLRDLPLMVLLDTAAETPHALPLYGELLAIPLREEPKRPSLPEDEINFSGQLFLKIPVIKKLTVEELADARIALLSKLYTAALVGDDKAIEQRATQTRSALGEEASALEKMLAEKKSLPVAKADQIAGIVAQRMMQSPSERTTLLPLLASAVKERLCQKQIEGSRWATSSGCGVTYEAPTPPKDDDPDPQFLADKVRIIEEQGGCGMGYVPEKSWRFLSFYTEEAHS